MPFGPARRSALLSPLLSRYQGQPGVADELLDAHGNIRPVWRGFIDYLATIPQSRLPHMLARGDQYLHNAGVYFRQYDGQGSAERDWPLSHMPILIDDHEWQTISAGLIQRADLLEAVVSDIYGKNRLAASGHLPASLIAASKEWLRPMVGVQPRGGHFLHFVAFEIGRGPDGSWWVLGDRTQAPSGAGFALENRVATAKVFADFYTGTSIHRLAGFFRRFRDTLNGMRRNDTHRASILTPGPMNESYFEHAYIARYLGFGLLEGEDLAVEEGQLKVRTVSGLVPVEVLWRRLDSNFADPLELDETSQLGTAGMVHAARQGNVTLVNALGSGILESRAFLAFMPRLSEHLLGQKLALPSIATWWCGHPAEAEHVRRHAAHMMIGEALSTRLPFEIDEHGAPGNLLQQPHDGLLERMIDEDGARFVGPEVVTLSTTPALVDGVLVPRPMSLRVFLARTSEGWQVMPGGYARVGKSEDPTAIAMRRGGSVADVWVVSDRPVSTETMMAPPPGPFTRALPGTLPSRAADNLFWLGRYIERVEGDIRLLRAYHLRLAEGTAETNPLLELLHDALEARDLDVTSPVPAGLLQTLRHALNSASKIRERFSVDGWMALQDVEKTALRFQQSVMAGDDAAAAMRVLLRKISGFSGLVHENMYRFVGWRFLSIGRALERATFIAAGLTAFVEGAGLDGALELAIEIGDSAMTHRRQYSVAMTRNTVVDLITLDPLNPRSILFSVKEMHEHISYLPGADVYGHMSPLARAVLRAQSEIAILTPETFDGAALDLLSQRLGEMSDILTLAYFQ